MKKCHYWCYKEITNYENAYNTFSEFNGLMKKLKYHLLLDKFDDVGLYKADINANRIAFNNVNANCKSYDTFIFEFNKITELAKCEPVDPIYNTVVSLAIICIANNVPEFCFRSTYTYDEWKPFFKLYEEHVKPITILSNQMLIRT